MAKPVATGGSLTSIREGVYRLRYDVGIDADGRRKQRCETFKGTENAAQKHLRKVLNDLDDDAYVQPKRMSVAQYLTEWHKVQQQVGRLRRSTLSRYHDVVRDVSKSEMGLRPLQVLRETHLEAFYASVPKGSRHIYHAVIRRALTRAVKEKLLASNPAAGMENAPTRSRQRQSEDAKINCWSEADAHQFLRVAKQEDPQTGAFFALALDVGARRSELLGLLWSHFDADGETITIEQQLVNVKGRSEPEFGPVKNSKSVPSRTVHLNSETVRLLREHRRHQAERKMENRIIYKDFGLVFAKEWGVKYTRKAQLGQPLGPTHIGERLMDRLIEKAGVKRITIHGLRHTVATLMLNAGIPVHQVAARLGDRETTIMETYAHCLKDAHREAARTLGRVLHDEL